MRNLEYRDKFRGCLIGGAVGDALGFSVEFLTVFDIFNRYGENGITKYDYDWRSGLAEISDDTQMTMFTANGILYANTQKKLGKSKRKDAYYIYQAYLDWLRTQVGATRNPGVSWLLRVPDLYSRRAPGMTCLSALMSGDMGSIEEPINGSKGCGGVMRVAPIGLYYGREEQDIQSVMTLAAEAAAITHGHSLGYISAAALAHIVNRVTYGTCMLGNTLYDIVKECILMLRELFLEDGFVNEMVRILELAMKLSHSDDSDMNNIHKIGGGWIGEEALGIAVYCCLKYQNDFSKAMIAAVNHSGDSDSTGAIAGNILGAMIGYEAIPAKWKKDLELHSTILELADDLWIDCPKIENGKILDSEWEEKYAVRW